MNFQPQKKLGLFDKWVCLGKTLNLDIYSTCWGNFEEIWGNPREIPHTEGEILGV